MYTLSYLPGRGTIDTSVVFRKREGRKIKRGERNFPMNGKTVLFVDDNEYLLKMVNYLFMSKGVDLVQAKSGLEGLEKLKSANIDLIISDVSMPEMNGIEFCREVKKNDNTSKIPIVILSALPIPHYKKEMLDLKITDFFEKPFTPKDLVEKVLDLLGIEKAGLPEGLPG